MQSVEPSIVQGIDEIYIPFNPKKEVLQNLIKYHPCPFCGSDASVTQRSGTNNKGPYKSSFYRGTITCTNDECGATVEASNPKKLVQKWTKRFL